jgi:tRNA threonylcarbamoyladenosine biosynthesis protein TsaE
MIENFKAGSLDELQKVAKYLIVNHPDVKIWALTGELGAGKTAMVKCFATALGITEEVSSPTFSLINEYRRGRELAYHFDLYRTKSMAEILDIGFEDYLFSGSYCFIEWPEKIKYLLPDFLSKNVNFEVDESGTRFLTVQ